jgi:hypothetical protein
MAVSNIRRPGRTRHLIGRDQQGLAEGGVAGDVDWGKFGCDARSLV